MKYKIGNQTLVVNSAETKEGKGTPHQVVSWRDCAETCRNLDAICNEIANKDKSQLKIVDAIARAGFWSAVFHNKWANCILHINEENESCKPVLKRNFPNDIITHYNIRRRTEGCDLVMLDFDDFTLKKLYKEKWENVISCWDEASSKYLIIAESACFGFKFGNMKHYGITNEEDYYYLLKKELQPFMNKTLTKVSKFNNSAIVLFENTRRKNKDIKFIPSSYIPLSKGNKTYGNYSKPITPLF